MNTSTKNPQLKKYLIILLFALYILALIWVIVFKCNRNGTLHILRNQGMSLMERLTVNAIPFKKVFNSIAEGSVVETLALIFNVICFLPFGHCSVFL